MAKSKPKRVETINPDKIETYFQERMHQMGITDTGAHGFQIENLEYPGTFAFQPLFTENKETGNITIHYPCLYGGYEPINGSEDDFFRVRYQPDRQPDHKTKYFQPPASGVHIFHPPAIVKKFGEKTHIETLYLVEGEFKAFVGSQHGLDIVGLGGKDSFRDEDKKNLHPDIAAIVRDCTVTNLVMLLDADTLQVKWDYEEEPQKDLAKGLYGFFNTAVNFREAAKLNTGVRDTYFAHLKLDNLYPRDGDPVAKGLDDLLYIKRANKTEEYVINDLQKLSGAKVYFDCINIGTLNPTKIRGHFWLNFYRGLPSAFYANNEKLIKDREFKFSGAVFQHAPDEGLKVVKHADTDKYIRVGGDYYKMIEVPDPNGELQPNLVAWKPAEINRDYGKSFFNNIAKYDSFCNVPCNTPEGYERAPYGCYNLYYPITHTLEEGKWPTIEAGLKHLFGDKVLQSGFTNFDLILDYFTILYRHPTQALPIVTLYSEQRNTGKSTGIWLLEDCFLANYTEITNDILEDHLNDDWATKLVIAMDEGFIDKNKVLQKLKSLSTAHKIMLRGMYAGRKPVPFFGKFWITTNDKNFIKLEEEETRFWINEVPVLTKIDPDFRQKMRDEVPYFLYHLATREIKHPKVSRHWFAPNLLDTEIGSVVKANSKGWFEKEMRTIMTEEFFKYRYHTLYFTHDEVEKMLSTRAVKFRSDDIREQLKQKFGLVTKLGRYKQPQIPDYNGLNVGSFDEKHQRCYTFRIEDFVSIDSIKEELHEFMSVTDIVGYRDGEKHPTILSREITQNQKEVFF